jgi:ATP synthase protein I
VTALFRRLSKPIRIILRWQLGATLAMALVAGLAAGRHGAISAATGGAISIVAGLTAAFVASRSSAKSAGGVLAGALAAEAVKIVLAMLLLWIALASYSAAMVIVLVGSFAVTMLIFATAFFIRDY